MKILKRIDNFLLYISGIALLAMMMMIVIEVVLRKFFSYSIPGNYEFTQNYLMPIAILPILSLSYTSGILPKLNMIVTRVQNKVAQRSIHLFLLIIEIITFMIVAYYTSIYAIKGVSQGMSFTAGGIFIPLYPILIVVAFGFILMAIKGVVLLIHMFKDKDFVPFP